MSDLLCPECDSKDTYSYLHDRKCGECGNTWLSKLDQSHVKGTNNFSKTHAMSIVTRNLNPSSFTSKFASLNQPIDLPKKVKVINQVKKTGKTEEKTSEKVVESLQPRQASPSEDTQVAEGPRQNIRHAGQQVISIKIADKPTGSIDSDSLKILGSTITKGLSTSPSKLDTSSQHRGPQQNVAENTEAELRLQKSHGKKMIRVIDSSYEDDFVAPIIPRAAHKRAREAAAEHSDTITHMTDDDPLPEMLPQGRRTRQNPNGIIRKPNISSTASDDDDDDDEMSDVQKPSRKKSKRRMVDAESSEDEYVQTDDDDDDDDDDYSDDNSFYNRDDEGTKSNDNKRESSVDEPKSSNTTEMDEIPKSAKKTPSEQSDLRKARIDAGISDSDDPFSDLESQGEEVSPLPKTPKIPKAKAVSNKDNPYLKFFNMEYAKLQEGRKEKVPYDEAQAIISERYRALSEKQLIELGKLPSQIKRQRYLYNEDGVKRRKPKRPKHVVEAEKKAIQERNAARAKKREEKKAAKEARAKKREEIRAYYDAQKLL